MLRPLKCFLCRRLWLFCIKLLSEAHRAAQHETCCVSSGALQAKTEGHKGATPEEGPWLFTLDFPSFQPVLSHAKNRCPRLASRTRSRLCNVHSVFSVRVTE